MPNAGVLKYLRLFRILILALFLEAKGGGRSFFDYVMAVRRHYFHSATVADGAIEFNSFQFIIGVKFFTA